MTSNATPHGLEPVPDAVSAGGTVLIVDDDAKVRGVLSLILKGEGFSIFEADCGRDAIEQVQRTRPDAVLLDVRLPDLSGIEVCREIRRLTAGTWIPVVLITAFEGRADRLNGLEAGADDYILKPVDHQEVALRMRNCVRARRLFEQVDAARRQGRETEALKDRLLHLMMHDMRSPLMVIDGYLQLLREEGAGVLSVELKDYVDLAAVEAATLIRMINALYDIDALRTGRLSLQRERRDLVDLARRGMALLGPVKRASEILWDAPRPVWVDADGKILTRVIANMLSHVLRHTPDEGWIRIGVSAPGGAARLSVTHTGTAIAPEDAESVFQDMAQQASDAQRRVFAERLGLAFCRTAVEAHFGRVGVAAYRADDRDAGNTLWFELPLVSEGSATGSEP